jgi:hypothetical protein
MKKCKMKKCKAKPLRERRYCPEHKNGVGNPSKTYKGKPIVSTRDCKVENCPNDAKGHYYYCPTHRHGKNI